MRTHVAVLSLCIATAAAASANATWMSGGLRNVSNPNAHGQISSRSTCFASGNVTYCPFLSDTDAFFGGDNSSIYVDYDQTHSGTGYVISSACRQSWTGGSYVCASGTSTSSSGSQDVSIAGFSSISGTPSAYDYFFVVVSAVGAGESAAVFGLAFI